MLPFYGFGNTIFSDCRDSHPRSGFFNGLVVIAIDNTCLGSCNLE